MAASRPAVPIPSATIVIARETAGGFEMFMVLRHHQIDFASGALVFPGGKTADGDHDPGLRDYCIGGEGLSDEHLSLRVAAIRETYEEAGILLAQPRGSGELIPGKRLKELKPYRQKLADGSMGILTFLKSESLQLAVDRLTLFAHWITPEMMPKRFDTHFYLAEAPADHLGVHDGAESVDSVWITPEQALADNRAGKRTIIFPTRMNIQKLARSHSIREAIASARASRVMTVQPWVENRADGTFLCIPPEAEYGLTEESLDRVIREHGGG